MAAWVGGVPCLVSRQPALALVREIYVEGKVSQKAAVHVRRYVILGIAVMYAALLLSTHYATFAGYTASSILPQGQMSAPV